ncbi:MAG: DUF4388 domain-containing protein [Candidatus Krumholzibacteria bacterium]|nr:DUF4388 domain-containing protein [Candidatus Krumholzibacteria bacterium]
MALEGNVRDFGLSEILQLIALQKKSGMLSITGEQTMVIYFREGQVISTRDRRKLAADPFRDYVLKYGFISVEEMDRIQQIQAETNLDLTDILVSEKKFSDDELRIIFAEQIQETIQEILTWPRSQYKFIIGSQVLQGVNSFGSFKVEGLLMESMRRIDEFPELERIFPSENTIVKRLPAPAEGKVQIEELEDLIYDILDTPMSIAELVPKARMSRFSTYEALKCLLEKGLLQIIEAEKSVEPDAGEIDAGSVAPRRRLPLPAIAAALALISSLAIGELAVPRLLPPGWGLVRHGAVREASVAGGISVAPTLGELRSRLVEAAVREALEEHLAVKGAYPTGLETLVANGFMPKKIFDEAVARGFSYRLGSGGQSYSLGETRP